MPADDLDSITFPDQPISQLLVKVASRCNIDCSYCYWFRDAAVYDKPKLMSADVLHRLLQRIEEHVAKNSLIDFPIILHGGEPLLWGEFSPLRRGLRSHIIANRLRNTDRGNHQWHIDR